MHRPLIAAFFLASGLTFGQNLSFNASQACLGTQTTIIGSYAPDDSLVSQWLWDFDADGIYTDGYGRITNYLFPSSGTHSVNLKVTLKAGGADSTVTPGSVTVHPLPQVNYHVDNLCEGGTATYTNQSAISSGAISQFLWDFNNDGVVDDNSGPVVSFTNGPAGVYVGKLECISDRGCAAFATKTTEVFPVPSAAFTVANACDGNPVTFTNLSTVSSGVIPFNIWTFGDGISDEVPTVTVTHEYPATGSYYVRLVTVTNELCRDTAEAWATVFDLPVPSITVNGDSVLYNGATTTLAASGGGAWLWSDGSTTASITVSKGGVYTVSVTDANGCTGKASKSIAVKLLEEVEVRNNLLTPNGDGTNDVLYIEDLIGYDACELNVYNIWGDLVYSSSNYKNDWKGDHDGTPLDGGAYYYIAKCDDKAVKKGNINILR